MSLAPYRRVLARRGVPALLVIAILARIPLTAAPVVLTLHVVLDLHLGFARAGLLGAVFAIGAALGSPLLGRGIDRVGLRPVLVLTTAVEGAFWVASPRLGFSALLITGFVAGVLAIPIFSLTRQALSAMVPPTERQAGFSLDSMGVELSFAVGPAAGISLMTAAGADVTLLTVAALIVVSGVSLIVLNPQMHAEAPAAHGDALPAPERPGGWLGRPLIGLLIATFASTVVVVGTDTALTGVMTDLHRVDRLSIVFVVWCFASLLGGFIVGASSRRPPAWVVLAGLAVLCIPVAAATSWQALALLIIPTGMFCAPVMSISAEAVTRITPAARRGFVLGLHASALTIGNAVGAPLTGLVVDHAPARFAFAALGGAGLLMAALSWLVGGRSSDVSADISADVPAEQPSDTSGDQTLDAPHRELLRSAP